MTQPTRVPIEPPGTSHVPVPEGVGGTATVGKVPAIRAATADPSDGFRPDLEGLRGVAVALVVLYHAAPGLVPGGFIGVDAFFVLSGFLITGLLVREHESRGRIDLSRFYARRARRILPAAAVTIAVTLALAAAVLPPLDLPRMAGDAVASTFSLANLRFAVIDGDYFAPTTPSPFRQFWSLAVEEQFYLLWPALVIVAIGAGRLVRRAPAGSPGADATRGVRVTAGAAIATVLVASLAFSLWLTPVDAPIAFYGLPTRAWQLALGGLLAVGWPLFARVPRSAAVVAGWAGLAVLVAAAWAIGPTTPYPGVAAIVPAAAAAAIIVAAGRRPGAALVLMTPLVRFTGRISYSLYLWHWPILVLPVAAGLVLDPTLTTLLVGASIAVATISWAAVETPFRSGRISRLRPAPTLAAAACAILAMGAVSTGLAAGASAGLGQADADVRATSDGGAVGEAEATDPELVLAPVGRGRGASSAPSPESGALPSAPASRPAGSVSGTVGEPASSGGRPVTTGAASPAPAHAPPSSSPDASPSPAPPPALVATGPDLPSNLTPSISAAAKDGDGLLERGCGMELRGVTPPECVLGDPKGTVTVVLVGDSHASQWAPAIELLAAANHWRFIPFTKYSCVFVDMRIWSDTLGREYTECEAWREKVVARLVEMHPDLVVIASHRWFRTIVGGDDDPVRQGAALARLIERIGAPTAVIADTPLSLYDVPACLSAHPHDVGACATPASVAFGPRPNAREKEAARLTGAKVVDLSSVLCPKGVCAAVLGRYLTMRDDHHLTRTFAQALAPYLAVALARTGLFAPARSPEGP